ncbi:hypothetical protein D3C81_1558070 [compost metagenome]
MKHSSITVSGTKNPGTSINRAPSTPKQSSRKASSSSGRANWPCNRRRREKLISRVEVIAPATNDSRPPNPPRARSMVPTARLSATEERMPVMCEVYCCTARKPPALAAPAMKARHSPN